MAFDFTTMSMVKLSDQTENASSDSTPTESAKPVLSGLDALGSNLKFPSDLGSETNSHSITFFISVVENEQNKKTYGDRISSDSPLYQRTDSSSVVKTSAAHTNFVITSYKRLKSTIQLPFPDNIVTNYSLNWEQDNAGVILGGAAIMDKFLSGKLDAEAAKDGAKLAANLVAGGVGSLGAFIGADAVQTANQLGQKQIKNPRIEVLFRGVNNRTFDMSWDFFPSDEQESADIRMILQAFKYHAHPEMVKGTAGSFFLYPSVFDIELRTADKQNPWLFQTSTCALTNISINMTPTGTWNAVEGNQQIPSPVGYNLSLSFMEMEILEKGQLPESWAETSSKSGSKTELRF